MFFYVNTGNSTDHWQNHRTKSEKAPKPIPVFVSLGYQKKTIKITGHGPLKKNQDHGPLRQKTEFDHWDAEPFRDVIETVLFYDSLLLYFALWFCTL